MQPSPEGYSVRVTLKNANPAALVGDAGVSDSQSSCVGPQGGFQHSSRPVFTGIPVKHGAPSALATEPA
jgi:hypothetical protein